MWRLGGNRNEKVEKTVEICSRKEVALLGVENKDEILSEKE